MPRGEFLLEVRAEEIPARMLEPGVRSLATRLFEELMARGLTPREVVSGFTPRRLVLTLKGLKAKEPDREEELAGPPAKIAYDGDGQPTRALLGFAKKAGLEPEGLERRSTDKGDYLFATRSISGRPTSEVLAELVPRLLTEISWPRAMRWGAGVGPWVRPVHGIVALFEGEVVPFSLFGVGSGDRTVGHRVLSPAPFSVKGATDYQRKLKRRGIVVGFTERRDELLEAMNGHAAELGGTLVEDAALLDKLASICGTPGVIAGAFDSEFLKLPREVLIASLRDHQSALTVEAEGVLLPAFLTVMDRADDPSGRVRAGNEWVVAARLSDARFFWETDKKTPLGERRTSLAALTFQESLGSYADKTDRIRELAKVICRELGWNDIVDAVSEAANLLKADLTCEMVKEFTSLQGVMGGVYAREEGYPEAIWQAVYDQYTAASSDSGTPRGRVGRVAALADRIDTVVGIFGVGMIPTGSKDPFGLRRAAQAAVRIVLDGKLEVDLGMLAGKAVRLYGDRLTESDEATQASVRTFLADRVRYLLGRRGYAYDEIEAGLAVAGSSLPDLEARVAALNRVRDQESFLDIVLAAKRIENIVREADEATLDVELLAEPAERDLHGAFTVLRTETAEAEENRDYDLSLSKIAEFSAVLDRFFVEVLVMDENLELRRNRIALLQAIQRVLSRTARLTEMVVDRSEKAGR